MGLVEVASKGSFQPGQGDWRRDPTVASQRRAADAPAGLNEAPNLLERPIGKLTGIFPPASSSLAQSTRRTSVDGKAKL